MSLSADEIAYLDSQFLGRLATVDGDGAPQNNPVAYRYNADLGTIDIGGHRMATTRKYRNLAGNDRVAFVVDDVVSRQPFQPRCLEIRGRAEALTDQDPPLPGMTRDIIRIHPDRVLSFGLDQEQPA
jgi:pyridoxamine 5'-phosphate oxidase family protein